MRRLPTTFVDVNRAELRTGASACASTAARGAAFSSVRSLRGLLALALCLTLSGCSWFGTPWWTPRGFFEEGVRVHIFHWAGPGRSDPVRVRVVETFRDWDYSTIEIDPPDPVYRAQGQLWMQVGCKLMMQRRQVAFTLERDNLEFTRAKVHFLASYESALAEVSEKRQAFTGHHCLANSIQY